MNYLKEVRVAGKGKKQVRGKWNFLVMRPKGEVANFAVSPLFLAAGLLFALAFTIGALLIANRHFSLYLDYQEMAESRREIMARLNQLEGQYQYQISLVQDYAELMNSLGLPGGDPPGNDAVQPPPLPPEAGGASGLLREEDPLETWAALLPDLDIRPEDSLEVDDFRVEGNRFSFQLINEAPGSLARGRLLTLFLVEAEGRLQVIPFPNFDPQSPRPNFEPGPGYNIRSSKHIAGQLKIPAGSEILAAMVAAQSNDGRMVMKKRLKP